MQISWGESMKIKIGILKTTPLLLLFHAVILLPLVSEAQPVQIPGFYGSVVTPPRNALPVPKYPNALPPGVTAFDTTTPNKLTIWQSQPKAIIDWSSFNIGADAWTHFDQQGNSSWVALNRIWDRNPSYIFGKLTADGKIYLINQNGILFGPGSKVNVNTLVASALNINNDDFLNEIFRNKNRVLVFKMEDYQGMGLDSLATVSNHGEISTTGGGSVFLMAPRVDNCGLINAPTGQVGLIAGTEVTLAQPDADDRSRSGYYVIISDDFSNPLNSDPSFGKAVNCSGGVLLSDGGIAGAYGNNTENWGIIRSTTAYKNKRGQIELRAANKVITGANSSISLPVDVSLDPDTGKPVTVDDTFDIQPVVDIKGLHQWPGTTIIDGPPVKQIEIGGMIEAPAGNVTLRAGERVYLETGSHIDVSGVVAAFPVPMISDFKLNSVELRDAYGQKGGILQGEKITTSLLNGSTIGDLSQAILTRERTAIERSIGGARRTVVNMETGKVTYNNPQFGVIDMLTSNGDIIVKQGAVLDFSGGAIHYAGGFFDTTKLLSGGKIYDISSAPLHIQYDRIMGEHTKTHERFGVREKYTGLYYGGAFPLKTYVESYTVGGDAGLLTLSAANIVLDGQLDGAAIRGAYQNTWTMKGSFNGDNAASDYDVAMALSVHRGLETPRAGTLKINTLGTLYQKGRGSSISVVPETTPQTDISPDTARETKTTVLSAEILNNANLGILELQADLAVSTDQGTTIRLQPGGQFSANARRIDHQGEMIVPAGSIDMILMQNNTSKKNGSGADNPLEDIIALPEGERIILGARSRLDVSGEKIDNRTVGRKKGVSLKSGQTVGGSIRILNETDEGDGVFIKAGAVVDVSGGYTIDPKGKITGGNAGILGIQGSNIMLEGDLRGHALADENGKILGGAITLTSKEIHLASRGDDWSGFRPESDRVIDSPGKRAKDRLYLASNRFDDTGFTQVKLNSYNDLIIEPNTTIRTSLLRLNYPTAGLHAEITGTAPGASAIGEAIPGRPDFIRLKDSMAFMAGPSSFTANANIAFEGSDVPLDFEGNLRKANPNSGARVVISPGSAVFTAPSVSAVMRIANDVLHNPSAVRTGISLNGPIAEVHGTLESFGGNISVKATNTLHDLLIGKGAQLLARGYSRPDPASTPKGIALNNTPVGGGSISLSAARDLKLEQGSTIDISGSDMVENRMRSADGTMVTFKDAGNPGSLTLAYAGGLTWNDTVKAGHANMAGIRGASLTLNKGNEMDVTSEDIHLYLRMGFDDLTLKSQKSLIFRDAMSADIGRKLTLDAPFITGSGGAGQNVSLRAPWIVLTNKTLAASASISLTAGELTLSGKWIDVIGSTQFAGFQDVTLKAERDIRLSEALYNNNVKSGTLTTAGNLTLDADQIYPTSFYSYATDKTGLQSIFSGAYSDFTIKAGNKVTIQHSAEHAGGPIYSAGGSLTIEGKDGIEVKEGGFLAAPMGTLKLSAPGKRIYLAQGSVLTTAGNLDTAVEYGVIDGNSKLWVIADKLVSNSKTPISKDTFPHKEISLDADTNIVMEGAVINVSGGGSVFAYMFQPGIEGSSDPLARAGRYIVFKDNSFRMPGEAVYLQGGGGLSEGLYTLLPLDANNPQNARYAFMPGAYIIETQSGAILPGERSVSRDGYLLTIGFSAVADTPIRGRRPKVYSVRKASDVITEGHFVKPPPLTLGDGGDFTVNGKTAIIAGDLRAASLNKDYQGGTTSLSGTNVIVKQTVKNLLTRDFAFDTSLDQVLQGKLILSADSFSGKGFKEVSLGNNTITSTVTIESGTPDEPTALTASIISLAARDKITINPHAQINALTTENKGSGEGVVHLRTPGTLLVDGDATVHATHEISLDVNNVDNLLGNLRVDESAVTLRNDNIFFGGRGTATEKGLSVTEQVWSRFSGFEDITFAAKKDIQFREDTTLSARGSLTLDAAGILDMKTDGASHVTLTAPVVNIKNSKRAVSATTAPTGKAEKGRLTVNAANEINVGSGDVLFGGFGTINLKSANDLILKGQGCLATGNANLNITAARVITASDSSSNKEYIAPNFTLNAGSGAIELTGSGIPGARSSVPGGLLEIDARRIELATVLQSDGGSINLRTNSSAAGDGVVLREGGQILARGTDDAPGGHVILATDYVDASGNVQSGEISLETGSKIDVSARAQGDAGIINLSAPIRGVTLGGVILGAASGNGKGGSLVLDTNVIGDIAALSEKLVSRLDAEGNVISGGFTESLDLRARTGNIEIASGQSLQARTVKLTADESDITNGNINVSGAIDSSTPDGRGWVELYAKNNVNVNDQGLINVRGTNAGAKGGNVLLNSTNGWVNLNAGATINVAGNGGTGGTLYVRALRNGNDIKINLEGTIDGARAIYAEAVQRYVGSSFNTGWLADATAYYNGNAAVARLESKAPAGAATFHLLPGIEVNYSGDITVGAAVDFSSLANARYQVQHDLDVGKSVREPGVLTMRAGGNLTIRQNLVDHPTPMASLTSSRANDSWGFNLVAGADLNSANYLAVIKGRTGMAGTPVGNLRIENYQVVYTESAPIRFASGGDTVIGSGATPGYMINPVIVSYNLASYDGFIQGDVGRDLIINGGAIQTAIGAINIDVRRDLQLNTAYGSLGAIRTTGQTTATETKNGIIPLAQYWSYDGGGDINLHVGRHVGAFSASGQWFPATDPAAWDLFNEINEGTVFRPRKYVIFSANYGSNNKTTAGLVTMGGGSLCVDTGGDFLGQAGTFGAGDLSIYSGGDVKGRFLSMNGLGNLHAMGNFGAFNPTGTNERVQIELFNSRMNVTALGEIQIAAVLNPSLASHVASNAVKHGDRFVDCTYTENTRISLKSGTHVTIAGESTIYTNPNNVILAAAETILPATVNVEAGGNIYLLNDFTLTSSPVGSLRLVAGGDIASNSETVSRQILMSDIAPEYWYGHFPTDTNAGGEPRATWIKNRAVWGQSVPNNGQNFHGFYKDPERQTNAKPLHAILEDDTEDVKAIKNRPIEITSGGDIRNLKMYFAKKAEVKAKGDIIDIVYEGQNNHAYDLSKIQAGGNISMKYGTPNNVPSYERAPDGLIQGGPGVFFIQAGGSIDLGTLQDGIQTIGNGRYSKLGTEKSSLIIVSGYRFEKTADDIYAFFRGIQRAGDDYARWSAAGKLDDASRLLETTRRETISPFLGEPSGEGHINMTASQVATSIGQSDIFVIAAGNLNLGQTALPASGTVSKTTGITTGGGGAIHIFSGKDVNVNESRIMTFYGGDITVWSDQGNINAGRGSRTAVSASPPKVLDDGTKLFSPPAIGSGIRAVTYGENPPEPGNIHLFAPTGIIDAGEAEISGGKVTVGATQVLNVQNISFSAGSVGVPAASPTQGAGGLVALSGSIGSLTETTKMVEQTAALPPPRAEAAKALEEFITRWVDVEILGFESK